MKTTEKTIELTEEQFEADYPLVENHLDENSGYGGYLFETYGEELDFVRKQDNRCIWTWIDVEGGTSIVSGYHIVNRIGYLISTKPIPDNTYIYIPVEGFDDDEA
jgi:hypothetical protein